MLTIKEAAFSVGFDACGIAKAEELTEDAAFLAEWLSEGYHADMHYLERNFEKRVDPRKLVPDCKSVVAVLMNYFPEHHQISQSPRIAKYAYSATDYHKVLKTKLKELEAIIIENYGEDCVSRTHQHSFVDSAPVLERRWAQRAGLGWIGKNTQLIHTGLGSYTFIGILMLNIEVDYDTPILPHCGNCTRCIDACPTQALNNGTMDARKCISYQTIENKNSIADEFHNSLSNYAYGCDICADVCPWNKKWAKTHNHPEFNIATDNKNQALTEWNNKFWLNLTKEEFAEIFKKSAIQRAGYQKLKQNIEILNNTNKLTY